ncbi:MAG: hypothetical protein AAFY97_03540, partial [Pseudomonadota bacterium]
MKTKTPQLGLSAAELETLPFARHYRPQMALPQPQVLEALAFGPMASALFPPLSSAADLTAPGYAAVETGYTTGPGFGSRVNCLT